MKTEASERSRDTYTINITEEKHRRLSTAAAFNGMKLGKYADKVLNIGLAGDESTMRAVLAGKPVTRKSRTSTKTA